MYSSTSTMKSGRGYSRGGHYTKRGAATNNTSRPASSGPPSSPAQQQQHGHYYQQHQHSNASSSSSHYRGGHHHHQSHHASHSGHASGGASHHHHHHQQHGTTGNTIGERQWQESLETLQQIKAEGCENDVEAQNALNESLDALNKLTYPLSVKTEVSYSTTWVVYCSKKTLC